MKPAGLVLLATAGVTLAAAALHARAQAVDAEQGTTDGPEVDVNPWAAWDWYGQAAATVEDMQTRSALTDTSNAGQNLAAFLAMIRQAEGTARTADPYRVCYGYRHTIQNLADHPAITGEWRGESLANLGAAYVGKVSTAAGAYQIIRPTWTQCKRALGLPDFTPQSQDAAAVYLIKNRGALADVQNGRIETAINKCRDEWASLPGGTSGQPQRRVSELLAAYSNAGGYFA